MPQFFVFPAANFDGDLLTSFTGGLIRNTTALTGLENDVPYRVFAAFDPSGPFLPQAAQVQAVPGQFTDAMWSLTDAGTGTSLTLVISQIPNLNNSGIVSLQRNIDGAGWVDLANNTVGTYTLTGLTPGVSVSVRIRATNGIGEGPQSDPKSATPTVLAYSETSIHTFSKTDGMSAGTPISCGSFTVSAKPILIFVGSYDISGSPVLTAATLGGTDIMAGYTSQTASSGVATQFIEVVAPGTGSKELILTFTGTQSGISVAVLELTGADTAGLVGQFGPAHTAGGGSTLGTGALTLGTIATAMRAYYAVVRRMASGSYPGAVTSGTAGTSVIVDIDPTASGGTATNRCALAIIAKDEVAGSTGVAASWSSTCTRRAYNVGINPA